MKQVSRKKKKFKNKYKLKLPVNSWEMVDGCDSEHQNRAGDENYIKTW